MIIFDDFVEVMENSPVPHADGEEEVWWAAQGLDYKALYEWCVKDALDSVKMLQEMIENGETGNTPFEIIQGGYAMSQHIGFIMGWVLRGRAEGAAT